MSHCNKCVTGREKQNKQKQQESEGGWSQKACFLEGRAGQDRAWIGERIQKVIHPLPKICSDLYYLLKYTFKNIGF